MPYDEEGRFLYPLPKKKSRPEKKPAGKSPTSPALPRPAAAPEVVKPSLPNSSNFGDMSFPNDSATSHNDSIVFAKPDTAQAQSDNIADMARLAHLFNERELAELWNAQGWEKGRKLTASDGRSVKIVYRGRWSGGFGPDFRGAIIDLGGELLRGDVELHLSTQDWKAHGHASDSRYNEVILHVALLGGAVTTLNGNNPAALALLESFGNENELLAAIRLAQASGTRLGSLSESEGPCCELVAQHHPNLADVLTRIDELGENRFKEKGQKYEAACAQEDSLVQPFWSGLLEALGYSQNKAQFKRLSLILPLSSLLDLLNDSAKDETEERIITLEAAILGAAGLLPSQRKPRPKPLFDPSKDDIDPEDWAAAEYAEELDRRWALLERYLRESAYQFQPMNEQDWNFARVRPVNHPARRIAGLARWAVSLKLVEEESLLERLEAKITGLEPAQAAKVLATFFVVELLKTEKESASRQFWAQRYDLTLEKLPGSDNARTAPALIGADRAAEITINATLPFLWAYARHTQNVTLERNALTVYHSYPSKGSNELVENVARQVFRFWLDGNGELPEEYRDKNQKVKLTRLIGGAMRQQGLIQLHHSFCNEQNWGTCPLG
ncbi:DUF2851 family protein [Candidatus Chlorohelix sp.]|uniref:DUF2851 family protein n=1 Tax=Candidatus Chlorohelix sp. TaxID=3139201 RepID=UPI0030536511